MTDPEDYTVGWVCALTTEFVAARAFFDEKHEGPSYVAPGDDNSYALGRVGQHNVVMAVLPDGEYGTAAAATVAKDMLHSFRNVRLGLMVGIGGGAPSEEHDIRLGDIVVSSPYNGYGGVFQYDFGKTIQNQTFQATRFLNQPPTILRTAAKAVMANYELEGHSLTEDAEAAIDKIKKRKKFTRPAPESDRLYRPDVVRPLDSSITCSHENLEALVVPRKPRDEEEDDPMVHYGLIASANQLMKDATVRDRLAAEKGVLCFEMEAAGLMNTFPCLVIRGICDYSDSHKNKDWQGFAAIMAAAYAKDLLRQIPPNKVEAEKRISDVVGILAKKVNGLGKKVDDIQQNDLDNAIRCWLSPPDPLTNLSQARNLRHAGTGTWFLQSPSYQEWLSGQRRHIWIRAFAGSGKTVLSSTILDDLQAKPDLVVLSFFFDFRDKEKQTVNGLLRSLASQLYRQGKGSATHLTEAFEAHGHGHPSNETLRDAIFKMCETHEKIFIILDALDESTEWDDLLVWIEKMIHHPNLGCMQLLCTSRPEHGFIDQLPVLLGKDNCLDLDRTAVNADIAAYVSAELQDNPKFTRKKLSKDLRDDIIQRLGNGAEGMFRWASCQLVTLAGCVSPMAMERALEDLPRDLDTTYKRMIDSIPEELRDDSKRLLQFIIYSVNTVDLDEAIDFIATQIDTEPRGFDFKRRLFDEASVLKHCPGLVTTHSISRTRFIQLAHFSVKEYLCRQDGFDTSQASLAVMRTCIYYHRSVFQSSKPPHEFKLWYKAVRNWKRYAALAEGGMTDSAMTTIVEALHTRANCCMWTMEFVDFHDRGRSIESIQDYTWEQAVQSLRRMGANANELFWACAFGLHRTAQKLLREGAGVNFQHCVYGNPLTAACWGGSLETVQLLLRSGADVNAQGGLYGNALIAACNEDSLEIVQLLLDSGADVNARGGCYSYALIAASYKGSTKIVQLLLDYGADVNARGDWLADALTAASSKCYLEIVRILLAKGANVNASGGPTGDVLSATVRSLPAELRRHALSSGHWTSYIEGGHNDNALSAAVSGFSDVNLEGMELLLERGANPEIRGVTGRTPLSWAAGSRKDSMDILLAIDHVNPDARDNNGRTPLSWAAMMGHTDNVGRLLETGRVDPDARDNNGRTPLSWAAMMGRTDNVRRLLKTGRVDPDARDNHGRTPLSWAADARDSHGRIPHWWADRFRCPEVIKILLASSVVDVNSRDDRGRTPLFWAVDSGWTDSAHSLLESDMVDITTTDDYGMNLLQLATFKGDEKMVGFLLERGAPEGADFYGLQALFREECVVCP